MKICCDLNTGDDSQHGGTTTHTTGQNIAIMVELSSQLILHSQLYVKLIANRYHFTSRDYFLWSF